MDNNILTFKNDDEFILFAINPEPVFYEVNGVSAYKFNLSNKYLAIKPTHKIKIEDADSYINKRKCLNYRLCSYVIDNLI